MENAIGNCDLSAAVSPKYHSLIEESVSGSVLCQVKCQPLNGQVADILTGNCQVMLALELILRSPQCDARDASEADTGLQARQKHKGRASSEICRGVLYVLV